MAEKNKFKIGQPEFRIAETTIGRDCVTFSLPKNVLSQIDLDGKNAFFCITNGIIQISGAVPAATMPMIVLTEESFAPQE